MAIPQRVREAAAEADQMLQQLATPAQPSANTEAPAPAEPAPAEPPAPTEPAPTAQPPAPTEPAPTVQPTDPLTELQRLHQQLQTETGRRAAQDAEMAELRGRLQQLTEQVSRPPQPAAPPPAPVNLITDADRNDFGEDMIDFVGRVAKQTLGVSLEGALKRIATLEGQLRQIGKQAQTAHQSAEELAAAQYFNALDKAAPGWRATNDDPKFVDWLKNRDTFARKTRHELLASAHAEADAETVAEFFKAYWNETGASPAAPPAPATTPPSAPSVDPSSLVAPAPSNSPAPAANPRNGRIWTQAEIEQVYDDRMKKRITPEKFADLEAEISKAVVEGRVR